MIYTVTLNPSIDYVVFLEDYRTGALNRSTATAKFAGGKGINVSRVLNTLGVSSVALGFTGGFPGRFIEHQLESAGIQTDFIAVDEDTRINIKLKSHEETEINASGPTISEAQLQSLLQRIEQTTSEDIVVLAGSVPTSLPQSTYVDIAEIVRKTGAQLVVDAEKGLMEGILPYRPLFVKPNQHELEEMFDVQIDSDQDVVAYATKLIERGAQAVLVSLGGAGAIYVDDTQAFKVNAPKGRVVNTVGAGDSTVAGMLASLVEQLPIEARLKLAIASGSATAFNDDLAERQTIQSLQSNVSVTPINKEG
ncbi:1-phosphofructokinase [Staphylococcus ratti]|uniref:Tagatose-6-phosphate kinase n=1 Tax=Staphylococcus ratti TaxID=2892440 RepID=A0ABY3PBX2_9STAP|nr:1-phosphofructokinase [Staphylococcus ratti]UEX89789.1 1-phosphofructokinase [Staphylococcus ratti]